MNIKLWQEGILGEHDANKSHDTGIFLIRVNCALRAGDEHYVLRRPGRCITSQIQFKYNFLGEKFIVYREDTVTKTNKGGLKDMKKECKIVWIKPNEDKTRCTVCIIEKYVNLLPKEGTKTNFYL